MALHLPVALTIAGSDSSAGAGIQADLRTFFRLGTYGTSAITAVTAQNLHGVRRLSGLSADAVQDQVEAVLDGFAVRAVKTGMLWSAAIAERVAELLRARPHLPLVVDPVLLATTGRPLTEPAALAVYRELLLPRATLVTPNLDEAAVLLEQGAAIAPGEQEQAARTLSARLDSAVLLKGGHLAGEPVDLLAHQDRVVRLPHPRRQGVNTHGSGCVLAAAVTALLARGMELEQACTGAVAFVDRALAAPLTLDEDTALAGLEQAALDESF